MKRRTLVKSLALLPLGSSALNTFVPTASDSVDLNRIDPGNYDGTWWNRTPIRLIQTNLPEVEGAMDRNAYVQSIVDASANVVLFNTGGIVANYQTKLPYQWKNPYIGNRDLVGELIEQFHAKGIRYIARFDFSKLDPSIAEKKPEWLYVGTNGEHQLFNGLVSACLNGGYYQEYSLEILKEAISNYPFDGIFFNMMGYTGRDYAGRYTGICQCAQCKKRFKAETGLQLPLQDDDPNIAVYRAFQRRTADELYIKVTGFIKQQNPKLIIYNYNAVGTQWIASESGAEMEPEMDDIYHATNNVKRSLGSYNDHTPLNLIMYFQAIGYRNIGSSANLLRTWWLENMLHGAPVSMVVVGTLVHYEDRAFIPIANELFAFHKKHEKLFTNIQAVNKLALVAGSREEYQGLMKLLSEEHVLYDVILPDQLNKENVPRKLADYEALIIPNMSFMNDQTINLLDDYVNNGGKLIVTGEDTDLIRLQSLGVNSTFEAFPKSLSTYLKVTNQDKKVFARKEFDQFSLMMVYSTFLKCQLKTGAKGYMRFLPQTRFGPAEKTYYSEDAITDFPGLIDYSYGKGRTIYIPWMIGTLYNKKGNYAHRALFLASLNNLLQVKNDLETDASPALEITRLGNRKGAFEWIGLINHSGFLGTSVREPIPIHETSIRFRPLKSIKQLQLIRSGQSLTFKEEEGWISCTVPVIKDFELLLCLYR